ncbi:MAG TPA: type II secretion system protein [Candidatus Saccharimonadia bacterium]|nr:type II secretion system protein [Candidatus Saccharimonadia bacterium]
MKSLISQLGFTLIELLVVISVIGVLAVAVLSAINPIEQINKGRDTGARSDAAELINADDRYFATQEIYPWNNTSLACSGAACSPTLDVNEVDPASTFPMANEYANVCVAQGAGQIGVGLCKVVSGGVGGGWLKSLSATAEVKDAFVSRIQGQSTYAIYVYKGVGASASMYACFRPSSQAFQNEALVKGCRDINVVNGWGGASSVVALAACPSGSGTIGTAGYQQSATKNELICLP